MKKKQVQNQAQEGRSMVEMLGVLAIVGVLSIGGIAGYRMAMNRYQANQIANEINLMRTDAKMKVARGVDELLLGEPYDGEGGHLNFGSNYGVKVAYPVIISDEEGGEEGYSFTLSGISAGVCKPLTTLLWSMNDTASLKVNEDYYDEAAGNECGQDENKIEVAFSTKDIGGVSGESGHPDEPEPPEVTVPDPADDPTTCDPETCVGYCATDGICKDCPDTAPWDEDTKQCKCSSSNKHWNKEIEACAACGDSSHCTSSSKPICKAGVCEGCIADEECIELGKEHCSRYSSCVTCGTSKYSAVWNQNERQCDECRDVYPDKPNWSGSECTATCPPEKPYIDKWHVCVECKISSHCQKDDGQHYWCDTDAHDAGGTCELCPSSNWDESKQLCKVGECESNDDCTQLHSNGWYCYLRYGYRSTSEFNKNKAFGAGEGHTKSECRNAESDKKSGTVNGKTLYTSSGGNMTWWSAERFCDALGKRMLKWSDLDWKCYEGADNTEELPDPTNGKKWGYCKKTGEKHGGYSNVSDTIKELKSGLGYGEYWLGDKYGTDNAFTVDTSDGGVGKVSLLQNMGKWYGLDAFRQALCID